MYSQRNTENGMTERERAIYDQMRAAVRVKHESWKTGKAYAVAAAMLTERNT